MHLKLRTFSTFSIVRKDNQERKDHKFIANPPTNEKTKFGLANRYKTKSMHLRKNCEISSREIDAIALLIRA